MDEETKFSAVRRDDYTCDRNNDTPNDSSNTQNSGGSLDSVDISELKKSDSSQITSDSSHMVFSFYHHSYLPNDCSILIEFFRIKNIIPVKVQECTHLFCVLL